MRVKTLAAGVALATASSLGLVACSGDDDDLATLKILYRNESEGSTKVFQVLQQELDEVGIKVEGVPASNADFYTEYLQNTDKNEDGTWDLAIGGWGPDWYGNAAASFFLPLLNGEAAFAPAGANYGMYESEETEALIAKAVSATSNEEALKAWVAADRQVMEDAAIFPITEPLTANYHSKNLDNAIAIPAFQQFDPTNVTKTGKDSDTLYLLGTGDVDYMDPNVTYYSLGQQAARMFARQLYSFPAIEGKTTTPAPDLALGMPKISKDGKTITVTMRDDSMWNTSPARAVVAEDVVRGVKRSCNPVQPFGGYPNYSDLIVGFNDFCDAFAKDAGDKPTVATLKKGIENDLPGVTAPNDTTVVYKLTQPSPYFVDMLTMGALSAPSPVEALDYMPGTSELGKNIPSNGPYQIESYDPTKEIVFTQNPVWTQASDPIRKQNFTKMVVNETGEQESIQQQLQAGDSRADMAWDTFPPPTVSPKLAREKDPNLVLTPSSSTNPYIIFNTKSPNNDGALQDVAVRQALMKAFNRDALIKVLGGPTLNMPLTHIIPSGIEGSEDFNLYEYDPEKAKEELEKLL